MNMMRKTSHPLIPFEPPSEGGLGWGPGGT
jgi:hypothetical protein